MKHLDIRVKFSAGTPEKRLVQRSAQAAGLTLTAFARQALILHARHTMETLGKGVRHG